jgi:hypothetical protein
MSIAKSLRLTAMAVVGATAMFVAATSAQATTYTPSLADLAGFTQVGQSSAGISTSNLGIDGSQVDFNTVFGSPAAGPSYANVGQTGLSVAFSAGDTAAINVGNDNESAWTYQLFIETSAGNFSSAPVVLTPGNSALLVAALAGGGTITAGYVQISAVIPIPRPDGTVDRTAEYHLSPAPVPIPPALALFGGGIVGLGVLARKRKKPNLS